MTWSSSVAVATSRIARPWRLVTPSALYLKDVRAGEARNSARSHLPHQRRRVVERRQRMLDADATGVQIAADRKWHQRRGLADSHEAQELRFVAERDAEIRGATPHADRNWLKWRNLFDPSDPPTSAVLQATLQRRGLVVRGIERGVHHADERIHVGRDVTLRRLDQRGRVLAELVVVERS